MKVYEQAVRITDDALVASRDPRAMVEAAILKVAGEIVARHKSDPDPDVRGSQWVITTWHDMATHSRVYKLYCGAEFDVEDATGSQAKRRIVQIDQGQVRHFVQRAITAS